MNATKSALLICLSGILKMSHAQFNVMFGGNFGRTTPPIEGVGIGNFPNFISFPQSRFHINNFFCNQPNGPLNGLLFRSDGNQNIDNKWQMFTGTNANKTLTL